MSYDFKPLLKPLPAGSPDGYVLRVEQDEAQWAHYGRAVHSHLIAEGGIEQVITRLALRPGQTTKTIADALRVYLTTGTRP